MGDDLFGHFSFGHLADPKTNAHISSKTVLASEIKLHSDLHVHDSPRNGRRRSQLSLLRWHEVNTL